MSLFDPHSIWAVVGVLLFLIALYLVLEHYTGATNILGTLFNGSTVLASTLQGRGVGSVSANSISVR